MLMLFVYFIVAVILLSVLVWVINTFLPDPYKKYATVLLVVIAAIVVCVLLIQFAQGGLNGGNYGVKHAINTFILRS